VWGLENLNSDFSVLKNGGERSIVCPSLTLGELVTLNFGDLVVFPSLELGRKRQSSTGLAMEAKIQMFWRLPAHLQMFPACSEHPRQKE
jgi:hypothetical protein